MWETTRAVLSLCPIDRQSRLCCVLASVLMLGTVGLNRGAATAAPAVRGTGVPARAPFAVGGAV